jgi:hypothetical protein
MTTKGPPLQYEMASDAELEQQLSEPGLKGAVTQKPLFDFSLKYMYAVLRR